MESKGVKVARIPGRSGFIMPRAKLTGVDQGGSVPAANYGSIVMIAESGISPLSIRVASRPSRRYQSGGSE